MNKNNSYKLLLSFIYISTNTLIAHEQEQPLNSNIDVVSVEQEEQEKPQVKNHNIHSMFNIPLITIPSKLHNNRQLGYNNNDFNDYFYASYDEKLGISNPISSFLFFIKNTDSLASSTNINIGHSVNKEFKSYFGYGLYNTLRAASSFNIPIDSFSSLFLATSIDSYQGNFKYEDYQLNKPVAMSRKNNDQHIFKVIAQYQKNTSKQKILAKLMTNMHEGGVEGYTYSPMSLRAFNVSTGINGEFEQDIKDTKLNISTSHVFFEQYSSKNLVKDSDFIQSSHEIITKFEPLNFFSFLSMKFGQKILFEKEYTKSINRFGLGFLMERNMKFDSPLKPSLNAKFDMTGYHQEDLLFNKNIEFSISPTKFISTSINYAKIGRIPSLLELYADNGFFVGNKDLSSESMYSFSINNHIKAHKMLDIDANLFFNFIKDSIAYQPYKGNRLTAVNSEKAKRFGTELGLVFKPLPLVTFTTNNELTFYSKVNKTQKPLPQSSFLKGISKLLIGKEDFLSATLQTRYQTSSFFDFKERLSIKPYMLVDILAFYKINNNIGLSASIENILNEKGAKNSLYMPIPPLSFLAQIHINTL